MDRNLIYDSVIEMASDIRYMREDIKELKRQLKGNTDSYDKRISDIEKIQNLNTGKLGVILIFIGAGIVGILQLAIWSWDKIVK